MEAALIVFTERHEAAEFVMPEFVTTNPLNSVKAIFYEPVLRIVLNFGGNVLKDRVLSRSSVLVTGMPDAKGLFPVVPGMGF